MISDNFKKRHFVICLLYGGIDQGRLQSGHIATEYRFRETTVVRQRKQAAVV